LQGKNSPRSRCRRRDVEEPSKFLFKPWPVAQHFRIILSAPTLVFVFGVCFFLICCNSPALSS
jgi:hypothetical protein